MKTSESLLSKGKFIAEYSAHLMGAGVHTSRVVRNSKRIGEAFGLDVKLGVFHKNIILTIIDKQTNEACNEVIDIPAHPISFEHNSELSALSWEAVDNRLSLEELTEKYRKIVSAPMIHPLFVLLLVGFANASFRRMTLVSSSCCSDCVEQAHIKHVEIKYISVFFILIVFIEYKEWKNIPLFNKKRLIILLLSKNCPI